MERKDKKKNLFSLGIGIGLGMILYKVIFDLLWPMIFN